MTARDASRPVTVLYRSTVYVLPTGEFVYWEGGTGRRLQRAELPRKARKLATGLYADDATCAFAFAPYKVTP